MDTSVEVPLISLSRCVGCLTGKSFTHFAGAGLSLNPTQTFLSVILEAS